MPGASSRGDDEGRSDGWFKVGCCYWVMPKAFGRMTDPYHAQIHCSGQASNMEALGLQTQKERPPSQEAALQLCRETNSAVFLNHNSANNQYCKIRMMWQEFVQI